MSEAGITTWEQRVYNFATKYGGHLVKYSQPFIHSYTEHFHHKLLNKAKLSLPNSVATYVMHTFLDPEFCHSKVPQNSFASFDTSHILFGTEYNS